MILETHHPTHLVPLGKDSRRRKSENKFIAFRLLILLLLAAISLPGRALAGAESAVSRQIGVTPSAVSFGGVRIGLFGWKGATVTNRGTTALTISEATLTGSSSFFLSAPSLPLVLAPGKSTAFGIRFTPRAANPANGSLTIATASGARVTIPLTGWGSQSSISVNSTKMNFGASWKANSVENDPPTSPLTISPSGKRVAAANPQLSINPTGINFNNVTAGSRSRQPVTLTNTGNVDVTITQVVASGAGFRVSHIETPLTLTPGQNSSFFVRFAPSGIGTVTGSVTITSNASGSPATISLSGVGVAAPTPQLGINPTSINFNNVTVGLSSQQPLALTNTGNMNVTITQVAPSGAGFSVSGLAMPLTLTPGQNSSFSVKFAPSGTGTVTGSVIIASNANGSPATISLSGTGASPSNPQLGINPTSINFSNVTVGSSGQQSVALTNTGNANVTITQVASSGAAFSVSGISTPLTLTPGQNSSFSVKFAPSGTGTVTGGLTITSNTSGSPATISLSGTGVVATTPQLGINPTNINFNNVTVGSTSQQSVALTNTGNANVTITQVASSGAAFSISGISTPLTLTPGQNSSFSVKFAPSGTGTVTGSVTITSNASGSPATISLSGTGVAAPTPQLGINPTNINFNNVTVGSSGQQSVVLTNTGNANVTITQVAASGAAFSVSGISTPLTLTPGQNSSFSVKFAPSGTGTVTGGVTITSNASGSPATISLSGNGVAAATPHLTVTPNTVNFSSVVMGMTSSQTMKLTNTGNASLTVNTASVSGTGFGMSGLNTPLTLSANQSTTFTVRFAPQNTGAASGSLVLTSNDPNSPTTVQLSGTGIAATFVLTPNPPSVNFGNVNVGSSSSQNVTLTNSGNSNVNISQVNVTGNGFSATGIAPPVTLMPGQVATLSTTFSPSGSGNASGNIQVVSNASSPTNISLSGAGVQSVSHSATLSWTASTSVVVGYNIYRGGQSGGPYTKLNTSPVAATTFVDSTVQAGQTYFWVVTAVDSSGNESAFSNEVTATIPTP